MRLTLVTWNLKAYVAALRRNWRLFHCISPLHFSITLPCSKFLLQVGLTPSAWISALVHQYSTLKATMWLNYAMNNVCFLCKTATYESGPGLLCSTYVRWRIYSPPSLTCFWKRPSLTLYPTLVSGNTKPCESGSSRVRSQPPPQTVERVWCFG